MTYVSLLIGTSRRLLPFLVATIISLCVGVSCVLFPVFVPIAIVACAGGLFLWILPDLRTTPERLTRKCLPLYVYATNCIPYYIAFVIPGFPLISVRRTIIFAFVGLTLLTLAASSSVRRSFWRNTSSAPFLRFCILAYFGIIISSVVIASSPSNTLTNIIQVGLIWIAPFIAICIWCNDSATMQRLMFALLISLFICSIVGAIEFREQYAFLWKLMPSYARSYMMSVSPTLSMVENGNYRDGAYRAISTFTTSLSWAQMTAMTLPVAGYFIAHGKSTTERVLGAAGIGLALIALYCSGSRGGYVSAIAATCVFIPTWAYRRTRNAPSDLVAKIGLTFCTMGAVLAILAVLFVPAVRIRVLGGGSSQSSDVGRQMEWAYARPKILASPIWGYGFGNANAVVAYRTTSDGGTTIDDYRINLLVDNGIIGFLAYYLSVGAAIYISFIAYVRSRNPDALFGIAVASALVAYTLYSTALSQLDNVPIVFCLMGSVFYLNRCKKIS